METKTQLPHEGKEKAVFPVPLFISTDHMSIQQGIKVNKKPQCLNTAVT
jgi:hypothetical protein